MDNHADILQWGTDCLAANGYSMERSPEIVLLRPWSTLIRFSTTSGDFYLKQTPPALSLEAQIIQLLSAQCHASVPVVIAINNELHCFLMRDAGQALRVSLKAEFNSDLLCQAIKQYGAIQCSTEAHVAAFLKLGVPDWRLDQFPFLYDQMIKQTDFLKADTMTDQELQILHSLRPQLLAQCKSLASYGIPETIGIPDFNDNNVLLDPNTKAMTFIDWGEAAITHPFFSLKNCLSQAIIHHGVKKDDQIYRQLQDACLENWLGLTTKDQILELFSLGKQLWPIYDALGNYRLMMSVDLQALNSYYADRPNRLAKSFREYISKGSNVI